MIIITNQSRTRFFFKENVNTENHFINCSRCLFVRNTPLDSSSLLFFSYWHGGRFTSMNDVNFMYVCENIGGGKESNLSALWYHVKGVVILQFVRLRPISGSYISILRGLTLHLYFWDIRVFLTTKTQSNQGKSGVNITMAKVQSRILSNIFE